MEEVGFLVQLTGRPYLALQLPQDSCDGTAVLQDLGVSVPLPGVLGAITGSTATWCLPKALSSASHS